MANYEYPLDSVKVASPCSADWEDMIGNDRRRFCGQCELNVFDLSGMTKREAEELINQTEGRLCVRFFRRTDGTILTKDCPVGLRAIRRRVSRLARATLSAAIGFLSGLGLYGAALQEPLGRTMTGVMVREHPRETNRQPNFAVMGGLESEVMRSKEVDRRFPLNNKLKASKIKSR
jgi:hypothetical protein